MALTIGGRVIDDPLSTWRNYARRTRILHKYDLADPGDPAILTEGDVARTRIIASRITREECERLLKRANDAPWDCVGARADLISQGRPCPPGWSF
jgi:hypothetical protein